MKISQLRWYWFDEAIFDDTVYIPFANWLGRKKGKTTL
jgi:hypothetical protein